MKNKSLFKKGDIVKVKNAPAEILVQIMNVISNPGDFYYIAKYIDVTLNEKQYDCFKQSELVKQ